MKIATARRRIGAIRRAAKSGDDETAHRILEATHVDLKDLASRCDLSQGQVIDALMHYGRDKVLKMHSKEPTR